MPIGALAPKETKDHETHESDPGATKSLNAPILLWPVPPPLPFHQNPVRNHRESLSSFPSLPYSREFCPAITIPHIFVAITSLHRDRAKGLATYLLASQRLGAFEVSSLKGCGGGEPVLNLQVWHATQRTPTATIRYGPLHSQPAVKPTTSRHRSRARLHDTPCDDKERRPRRVYPLS